MVRAELRLTQEEFGHLVGLAQSRICKVENGVLRLRDIEAIANLATTLGVPAELLGFAPDLATLKEGREEQAVSWLQRRDFMAAVTSIALGAGATGTLPDRLSALIPKIVIEPPRRVGLPDVERIEATTAAFRDWDNRWGGGLSRAAVVGQLQWVIVLNKKASAISTDLRRRLLIATSDLASLAAWINYDVEQHEEARRLWMIGLDAAREAADLDLVGAILRQLVHQALHLDRPDEALRLVRLAHATATDPDYDAPDLVLSETAAYEAWCYAAAGNMQFCKRAMGKAEEHFAASRDYRAPPWMAHFDEPELNGLHGHVLHVLARRIPAAAVEAEPLLRDASDHRGPEYARSKTLNLIALSSTYFQQRDNLDEGVRVGHRALDSASTLNSPRALSRLGGLGRLLAPHQRNHGVADLRERLHLVLTDVA